MRVLLFGTYDTRLHPRIKTIAEGLRDHGADVAECNAPLGLDTADRVKLLTQPWRLPVLAARLASRWAELALTSRRLPWRPDVVVVGYLGHFDVHLARLLFPRTTIVLDHMASASGTGQDRGLDGGPRKALLRAIDSAALRAADIVVVDTAEHLQTLPARHAGRAVVVPVGAPSAWFRPVSGHAGALRVVFYGLYTPLQGAPVIGEALALLADKEIEVTMIGTGQDYAATRAAAEGNDRVRWLDWIPSEELPELVAGHDVCLGIFGTGDKARRVVPNKVFQGAAAGCAIVTSNTAPQRRAFGDAAVLVPPGDAKALAEALAGFAADRDALAEARSRARSVASAAFAPESVVAPLMNLVGSGRSTSAITCPSSLSQGRSTVT